MSWWPSSITGLHKGCRLHGFIVAIAATLVCSLAGADEISSCGASGWIEHASLKRLPPDVSSHLENVLFKDRGIADIGEPYNPTDVIDETPQNGVVLAGSNARCIFVVVENGGFASWHEGFVYRREAGRWRLFNRLAVSGPPKGFSLLLNSLFASPPTNNSSESKTPGGSPPLSRR